MEVQHEREGFTFLPCFHARSIYQQERSRGQLANNGVAKTEGGVSEGD